MPTITEEQIRSRAMTLAVWEVLSLLHTQKYSLTVATIQNVLEAATMLLEHHPDILEKTRAELLTWVDETVSLENRVQ